MELTERKFLEDNIINFQTIEHGYTRNLDGIIVQYEEIYKKYLDPGFVPQRWCGDCVFNMMKRLKRWYESQPKLEEPAVTTEVVEAEPKPKRKYNRK